MLPNGGFLFPEPPAQVSLPPCRTRFYTPWRAECEYFQVEQPAISRATCVLSSSGLAYVVAVGCMYAICELLGLSLARTLVITASFGLATVAIAYVSQVNNHILLLASFSALLLALVREASQSTPAGWKTALWI